MKIVLICHEIPYPPIHGGRVDMWRRVKAFSNLGVELHIVCWSYEIPSSEDISEIKKYVKEIYVFQIERELNFCIHKATELWRYPWHVAVRSVRGTNFDVLFSKLRTFSPDIIWLDGILGGVVATKLSKLLNVPLVTRSHNIEYLYFQRLLANAKFKRKLAIYLTIMHMEKYEKYVLKNSALFYDISTNDLEFWQAHGFKNGKYLPPIIDFSEDKTEEFKKKNWRKLIL